MPRRSEVIRRSLSKPMPNVSTTLSSSNRVDRSSRSPMTIFLRNTEHARARAAPHRPRSLSCSALGQGERPLTGQLEIAYGLRDPLELVSVPAGNLGSLGPDELDELVGACLRLMGTGTILARGAIVGTKVFIAHVVSLRRHFLQFEVREWTPATHVWS